MVLYTNYNFFAFLVPKKQSAAESTAESAGIINGSPSASTVGIVIFMAWHSIFSQSSLL